MLCVWLLDWSRLSCMSLRCTSNPFSACRFKGAQWISLESANLQLYQWILQEKKEKKRNTHCGLALRKKPQLTVLSALLCFKLQDFALKVLFSGKSPTFILVFLDKWKKQNKDAKLSEILWPPFLGGSGWLPSYCVVSISHKAKYIQNTVINHSLIMMELLHWCLCSHNLFIRNVMQPKNISKWWFDGSNTWKYNNCSDVFVTVCELHLLFQIYQRRIQLPVEGLTLWRVLIQLLVSISQIFLLNCDFLYQFQVLLMELPYLPANTYTLNNSHLHKGDEHF